MAEHRNTLQIFKALAHPGRLRILEALERQEACVCHLQALLGLRQPYISQQLAVLRAAGLVSDHQRGAYVFYRLADERVPLLLALGQREAPDDSSPWATRPLPNCPCPKCQAETRIKPSRGASDAKP